jgi:hypothetical protein
MPPLIIPAASTCGRSRPSVGFNMSDTSMLVGQTASHASNDIFHRGGRPYFFVAFIRCPKFPEFNNLEAYGPSTFTQRYPPATRSS